MYSIGSYHECQDVSNNEKGIKLEGAQIEVLTEMFRAYMQQIVTEKDKEADSGVYQTIL